MPENLITYSVQDNIAHIGLNDADRLNVLSIGLVAALNKAVDQAQRDQNVKVILLFGHGKGFCAGGDLKEFYNLENAIKNDPITEWEHISKCELPVIAAIHGYVVGGGCELMMMCDYAIAADNTVFSQPELKLGFIPGCGATQKLSKKIGYGAAFEMMASCKKINVITAKELGLVEEIVAAELAIQKGHEKAVTWAQRDRSELIALKQAMNNNAHFEREMFYKMMLSTNARNKIKKFFNKKQ